MTGAESRAIKGSVLRGKNEIEWGRLVRVVLCVDSSYEGQGAGDNCSTHDFGLVIQWFDNMVVVVVDGGLKVSSIADGAGSLFVGYVNA